MKKSIPLIVLSILSIQLYAQEYVPMIDATNEWHFTSCFGSCLTDIYFTDGDTLVNGKEHKILDGFHYISRTFLLREDVPTKKVYLTKVDGLITEEFLLYDFSLEEGDSIDMKNPIAPFPTDAGYYEVDSIRLKELVDGELYRHFYLSPAISNTVSDELPIWVEGAGSLSIVNAPGGTPDINDTGALSCFFKHGVLFYSNLDSIDGCEPILGINQIADNLDTVFVTSNQHNLVTVHNAENIVKFQMYNLGGKLLDELFNLRNSTLQLNTANFKSGIYILKAIGSNLNAKTFKVIVE